MGRRLIAGCAALALTSLLLAGCSDDSDEPSACGALQDVADDVRELGDTQLIAEGTDAVRDELDTVSESFDEARDVAGEQFGDEIDALQDAVSDVRETLSSIGDGPLSEVGDELRSGLDAVATAWDQLSASVDSELGDCDLSADS